MHILSLTIKSSIVTFIFFFLFFGTAQAASLHLVAQERSVNIGEEVIVDIVLDTKGEHINATQATLEFPTDMLMVDRIERADSVFNFWVEEPSFSNESGTVSFVGGTASSKQGSSLTVLSIVFKTTGSGIAEISLSDAVVTASDGKGTNVLSEIEQTSITIGTSIVELEKAPLPPAFDPTVVVVEAPEEIMRKAVKAVNIPEAPSVHVPIYPDPLQWYKHIADIIVQWDVPPDVTKVAIAVNEDPNTEPESAEEGLFTGKNIGKLSEGIFYIHVQFRNNVGWGEVAHYRIAIDTMPPLPFDVHPDVLASDNPRPLINHETHDALSGVSYTLLTIDTYEPLYSTRMMTRVPIQIPGTHTVAAEVFDKAGNSVKSETTFEVLPLPNPIVQFVSKSISQDETLFISGTTLPDTFVDITVLDSEEIRVAGAEAGSDASGYWRAMIGDTLQRGVYTIHISARDSRGAISLAADPETVKVRAKTVLSVGSVDLGWFELLLIVILIIISVISAVLWNYMRQQETRRAYTIIAARDLKKLSTLLNTDVEELESYLKQFNNIHGEKGEKVQFHLKQIQGTIHKMKKYVGSELEKTK